MVTLPCARIERTPDGTPFSSEYQDIYHSERGGLAQARHVFLGGNGLPEDGAGALRSRSSRPVSGWD